MKSKFVFGSKLVLGSKVVLGFIVSTVFLIVSLSAIFITSQPSFCGLCHEMRYNLESWLASSHSKVPCTACHIGPGLINITKHKTESLFTDIPTHFLNSFKHPINKKSKITSKNIPSINCTQSICHDAPKKKEFNKLVFVHSKHINKFNCAYCHNRVAHPSLKPYKSRATMEFCINCHKENNGSTACLNCHVPGKMQKPTYHYASNWIKVHKSRTNRECLFCHVRNFCRTCHARERATIGASWKN